VATWGGASIKTFEFKHLRYEMLDGQPMPLAHHYANHLDTYLDDKFLKSGISIKEAERRENFYGRNEHRVEVPGYFEFLFDTMTKPFFIFQYFVSAVYILESLVLFGGMMIGFSWLTSTVNYILLRRSYNQIKETAEKEFFVTVLRNGTFYSIQNIDLVPGDLYQLKGEVPCDSLIVQGELFVDEASLTGENVPIAKFRLSRKEDVNKSEHWVYEGSRVETAKENTLAMAVHVGYASRRGRIIRKILTKVSRQPEFFKKLIYFMMEVFVLSIVVYFATFGMLRAINIEKIMVVFKFLDYITYAFPAPFPIYFNLMYSFCLVRLHRDGILGTECEKTVESGRMKTLCFDKTGTLTQNKMEVSRIFHIKGVQER
jgi:cation-transporting P-type ATPase 13A2